MLPLLIYSQVSSLHTSPHLIVLSLAQRPPLPSYGRPRWCPSQRLCPTCSLCLEHLFPTPTPPRSLHACLFILLQVSAQMSPPQRLFWTSYLKKLNAPPSASPVRSSPSCLLAVSFHWLLFISSWHGCVMFTTIFPDIWNDAWHASHSLVTEHQGVTPRQKLSDHIIQPCEST